MSARFLDIVTLGELLIDMFPSKVGQTMGEVESFIPKPGGAPANVAVAAKRLGAKSAFIGKVGEDLFGHYLKEVLTAEEVDTRGIRFDLEARTTMAIIAMPDENTAEFVFYRNPGADLCLQIEDLDTHLLESTKIFHFGSLSLTDEPARSATYEAIRLARGAGALVSYDVNYRPSLWKDPKKAIAQAKHIIKEVDVLKVNEQEAALLTSLDKVEVSNLDGLDRTAQSLLQQGLKLVVVTLGPDGSYYQTQEGGGYIPPFKVDTVDSIGCGDAFVAGLLTKLCIGEGWQTNFALPQLPNILRFANAVGALTSMNRGVIPALPYLKQVENFIFERTSE